MNTNDISPATRAEAKARGLKHYFTGKPCSRGHIVLRHITGTCVECQQMANRAWNARNPEEGARRAALWQKNNPERSRARYLKYRRAKDGLPTPTRSCPTNCESCNRLLEAGKTHLDHCHETGVFRGWLCNRCNLGIGCLGDSVAGVENAIRYLLSAGLAGSG